jgi:hypothetical protein
MSVRTDELHQKITGIVKEISGIRNILYGIREEIKKNTGEDFNISFIRSRETLEESLRERCRQVRELIKLHGELILSDLETEHQTTVSF